MNKFNNSVGLCLSLTLAFFVSNSFANISDPYFTFVSNVFEKNKEQAAGIKGNPLYDFINQLPKGADLHRHFTGAVYPQDLIKYAQNDPTSPPWCLIKQNDPNNSFYKVSLDGNCIKDGGTLLKNVSIGSKRYQSLLKSWSMYGFHLTPPKYGHDHFFSVFGRRGALTRYYQAEMLADLMRQAYKEHVNYLELMVKPDNPFSPSSSDGYAKKYINHLPSSPTQQDIKNAIVDLNNHNFKEVVVNKSIFSPIKLLKSGADNLLHCGAKNAEPACNVTVRFQYQAIRTSPSNVTFSNLYAGFLLAKLHPNYFVGVNLVGPEDNLNSMQSYHTDMIMARYLHTLYPAVGISLHAGELSQNLVSGKELQSHIYDAISIGRATRIGHGVTVWSEEGAGNHVFSLMRKNNIPVEINHGQRSRR